MVKSRLVSNSLAPFARQRRPSTRPVWAWNLRAIQGKSAQPSLGRFIARDPIGHAGGSNIYSYCSADPTNFIDPDGLDTVAAATARSFAGMVYHGGYGNKGKNCLGDTLQGQGLNASGQYRGDPPSVFTTNGFSKYEVPKGGGQPAGYTPKVGDVVQFDGHWATIVDMKNGAPIVFGQDGNLGQWSGTLGQTSTGGSGPVLGYYRNSALDPSKNSQVIKYQQLKGLPPLAPDWPYGPAVPPSLRPKL